MKLQATVIRKSSSRTNAAALAGIVDASEEVSLGTIQSKLLKSSNTLRSAQAQYLQAKGNLENVQKEHQNITIAFNNSFQAVLAQSKVVPLGA